MTDSGTPRQFDTTHWSVVRAAGGDDSIEARAALATLCETYWWPLYWFARRRGGTPEDAKDQTQGFLTRLIEKGDVRQARQARGRFRAFLLAAFTHFILNDAQRQRAEKRGGGTAMLPLEFDTAEGKYQIEPADSRTPEDVYDRRWAVTVLDRALQALRRDETDDGRFAEFDVLKTGLLGASPAGGYEAWARALGTTEGAVKVAVHRLRKRFRSAVREEIANTVTSESEIDDELQYLMAALRR